MNLLPCSLRVGEESRLAAIRMASARRRACIRITGGCGSLKPRAVAGMYDSIVPALAGSDITVIGGGTRMVMRSNPSQYREGITETVPRIGSASPLAKTIGVVPRQTKLWLREGVGLVVSDKPANPYVTIIHPELDACLLLQYSADKALSGWDPEWQTALDYIEALRQEAGHTSAHLVYGGGATTEREFNHVVKLHNPERPWWVILVSDSGGMAEQYAHDRDFCTTYSDRLVVCKAQELRVALEDMGFIG